MLRARKQQGAAIVVIAALNKQRKKRKYWVRPWTGRKNALGACNTLLQQLHIEDPQQLRSFLRMTAKDFEILEIDRTDNF